MTSAEDDQPLTGKSCNYYRSGLDRQPPIANTLITLEAAGRIMSDWPGAFETLLDAVIARGQETGSGRPIDQAYSSRIGKMLRFPPRGSDGLPIQLIHVAVDRHWRRRGGKSRARNPTVFNAIARELYSEINATRLAATVGNGTATLLNRKVVKRAFELLTNEEQSLPRDRLAVVIWARINVLHSKVRASLTPVQAKQKLEGTRDHNWLSGWDHAELLQPDPVLQGLRRGGEVYLVEAVERVLARIRQLAVRVTEQGRMVPLVSVGMRVLLKEPRPSKTEILLRVFRGQLAVATLVDSPSLGDLLVDPAELNKGIATARALIRGPFLPEADLSALMLERHGPGNVLSLPQLLRLSRGGLVQTETRERHPGTRHPGSMTVFSIKDVEGIVCRWRAGRLSASEEAAFGIEVDVRPIITQLRSEQQSPYSIAVELTTKGFLTVRGAAWQVGNIERILRTGGERPVLAVRKIGTGTKVAG